MTKTLKEISFCVTQEHNDLAVKAWKIGEESLSFCCIINQALRAAGYEDVFTGMTLITLGGVHYSMDDVGLALRIEFDENQSVGVKLDRPVKVVITRMEE